MTKELVKGFRDFIGEEAEKRADIQKIIIANFEKFGFNPAETPVVEYEEFVKGENTGDKAVSDIFKLKDKGDRKLALRYEFTFQLKRIMKNQKLPYKRYQIGPVFRDEPVAGNRFRQFIQCDADVIGSTIKDEAEILSLASNILKGLGVEPLILINNRRLLNEILDDAGIEEKNKLNVLKEIDKYDKLPEEEIKKNLKKYKAEKILNYLKQKEEYFKKFKYYKEIIELMNYCKLFGTKVLFSPTIARGLSYYNGNVFEIKAEEVKLETKSSSKNKPETYFKETIVGGGSYMFEGIQCTGISFGLDRISAVADIKEKETNI